MEKQAFEDVSPLKTVIFLHIAICSEMSVLPTTFILAGETVKVALIAVGGSEFRFASTPETCGIILTPEEFFCSF